MCTFELKPTLMSEFYSLKISRVEKLTHNAVNLQLEIPENIKDIFNFKAGQYLTLKADINGESVRRAYSISAAPENNHLSVGIKKVQGGLFSTFAVDQLKEGDTLEVMPPLGAFFWESNSNAQQIALFAAGSGITPMMSIAKSVLNSSYDSTVLLVYGNKTAEDTMYREELISLKENYPERFKLEWVYSRADIPRAQFGRVDKSIVNHFLKNTYAQIDFNDYFICGPEDMINTTLETLQEFGAKEDQIHFERFVSKSKPSKTNATTDSGMVQIKVTVDEVSHELSCSSKTALLDAFIKEKIDVPYSCQGGVCSTCIARVTKGSAIMEKNEILTNSEIEEGLILSCQAHATSDEIHLDYDDV